MTDRPAKREPASNNSLQSGPGADGTDKKIARIIYIVLLVIAGILVLLILTGTIIGFVRRGSEPVVSFGNSAQTNSGRGLAQTDDIRIYSELGRLRITLADSSILILSIVFPYSASDITFAEELAAKVNDFRNITSDYFKSLGKEAISHIDEETAKQEILKSYNANLRLGSIEILYFEDLMLLDSSF